MKIKYTGTFRRDLEVLLDEQPKLVEAIKWVMVTFERNPRDSRLGVHALKKRLKGKWAMWVTKDVRIVFEWWGKSTVRFLRIGGHSKVYTRERMNKK